jgi:hypothetical protein
MWHRRDMQKAKQFVIGMRYKTFTLGLMGISISALKLWIIDPNLSLSCWKGEIRE